ncbi:uncharacterized protein EAF01_004041 [Botrytis porri]|uniref:uncharacterized protein n=1 Tax=Botrytis porri TaxID=87229 RepID=UPI0018FF3F4D|nr:uncharacterized protein EAF01_004041 [Botrytis porri]KAF7908286.1 hypothetical protein EAF01_004041 [Botrytis porri]
MLLFFYLLIEWIDDSSMGVERSSCPVTSSRSLDLQDQTNSARVFLQIKLRTPELLSTKPAKIEDAELLWLSSFRKTPVVSELRVVMMGPHTGRAVSYIQARPTDVYRLQALSAPRACNERYYYVQDQRTADGVQPMHHRRGDAPAFSAMRGADMNSPSHTIDRASVGVPHAYKSFSLTHADSYLCRQNQDPIDPGLQSLADQQTKCTTNHLHTHPGAVRRWLWYSAGLAGVRVEPGTILNNTSKRHISAHILAIANPWSFQLEVTPKASSQPPRLSTRQGILAAYPIMTNTEYLDHASKTLTRL